MTVKRIQRRRTKGWRMPENTVYVGRGSKWGNPWAVRWDRLLQRWVVQADHNASSERFVTRPEAVSSAVVHFAAWVWRLDENVIRAELAGKNLACWCPLDQPCHADVLLELANTEES